MQAFMVSIALVLGRMSSLRFVHPVEIIFVICTRPIKPCKGVTYQPRSLGLGITIYTIIPACKAGPLGE